MAEADPSEPPELPPTTAPEGFPVSVSGGFESEEQGRRLQELVGGTVWFLSSYINLGRLDGVTVADDYEGALQRLDRGFAPSKPLARSNNERIAGVAMSPAVMRNGVVRAHLLFDASIIRALLNRDDDDAWREALYTIAHECGHVEDLKMRDEAFPGRILCHQLTTEEAIWSAADPLWEEYAACRASAQFAQQRQISQYEIALRSVLDGARKRTNAAIREYRLHADAERVVSEAGEHILEPLRMFSYLQGTLDGQALSLDDAAAETARAIEGSPYSTLFDRQRVILRDLWMKRGRWSSPAEFDPLRGIVRDALSEGGLVFTIRPDKSVRLDVPLRPGTIPGEIEE